MHLVLILTAFIVVSDGLAYENSRSSNSRRLKSRAAQWTIIRDVDTDGSIAFPVSRQQDKRRMRPFPGGSPSFSDPLLPKVEVATTTTTTPAPGAVKDEDVQIPVSLFLNKSFNSLEDFMKNLVLQNEFRSAGFGSSSPANAAEAAAVNFLRSNSAARSGGLAAPANCEPQEIPVELERPDDPSLIYFPRCTKIQRCGGCCQHDLLMCVPTITEPASVNVMKARFKPETNSFQPEGLHPIALEKHLACECQCRVKAEDCNAMQDYRKEECRCICTNEHESKDCNGPNKFWDPQTCNCECRNNPDCSTGFFFDEHTCSCQPVRVSGIVFPSRRSGLSPRGHVPYDLSDDDETVELVGGKDETTTYSPWYISNVMRTNQRTNSEKRVETARKIET